MRGCIVIGCCVVNKATRIDGHIFKKENYLITILFIIFILTQIDHVPVSNTTIYPIGLAKFVQSAKFCWQSTMFKQAYFLNIHIYRYGNGYLYTKANLIRLLSLLCSSNAQFLT